MGIKAPLRNSHQRQVHLSLIPTVRPRFSILFHAFPGLGGTRRVISGTGVRPTVQWAVPGSGVPLLGDPSPKAFQMATGTSPSLKHAGVAVVTPV